MTRGRVGRSLFPVRGFLPAGIVAGAARVARMQILCVYIGVQDGIAARDEVFAMRCGGGALCVMDERFIGCFRAIGGMSKYKCCTEFRFCETIEINLIGCIINFNYIEEYFSFDLIQKNITFLYYKRILHLLKRFFNYF